MKITWGTTKSTRKSGLSVGTCGRSAPWPPAPRIVNANWIHRKYHEYLSIYELSYESYEISYQWSCKLSHKTQFKMIKRNSHSEALCAIKIRRLQQCSGRAQCSLPLKIDHCNSPAPCQPALDKWHFYTKTDGNRWMVDDGEYMGNIWVIYG